MNVHHSLICFLFLALRDRNTGLISAEIHTGTEGGKITVKCIFKFSGITKIFCKEKCGDGDFLIKTDQVTAQSGRYSIAYEEGTFPVSSTILNVSITKLTKSDAGKYRCGLFRSFTLSPSYQEFEIRVEDAPISSKPNGPLKPFSTLVPSTSTVTTTKSLSSSSGNSTHSSASPEGTKPSQGPQTTPAAATTDVLLYVRLTLAVMIFVLSLAVLIFCRNRASKPEEPENVNVTEANRVYEEISEDDRRSRSPSVELSAVYANTKPTKPKEVRTTSATMPLSPL